VRRDNYRSNYAKPAEEDDEMKILGPEDGQWVDKRFSKAEATNVGEAMPERQFSN